MIARIQPPRQDRSHVYGLEVCLQLVNGAAPLSMGGRMPAGLRHNVEALRIRGMLVEDDR